MPAHLPLGQQRKCPPTNFGLNLHWCNVSSRLKYLVLEKKVSSFKNGCYV